MNIANFLLTLPMMLAGMGGIFLIILLIMGVVMLLNRMGRKSK